MGLVTLLSIVACAGPLASALLQHDHGGPAARAAAPRPRDISLLGVAPPANRTAVKVFVFGDRWADIGTGPGVLELMFQERKIPADVRKSRHLDGGACNAASLPPAGSSLAAAIKKKFGEEVPDYVWFSAGAYDLKHPTKHPLGCKQAGGDGVECLKELTTKEINSCTDSLLKTMWEKPEYANVKVVQCGYDFACSEGICAEFAPKPDADKFCHGDQVCRRQSFVHFNEFLLGGEYHGLGEHADKYTGINILGAMQSAHGVAGAEPGKPNTAEGSPCGDTLFCQWPRKGTPGYRAIAGAFWDRYFSLQGLGGEPAQPAGGPVPASTPGGETAEFAVG